MLLLSANRPIIQSDQFDGRWTQAVNESTALAEESLHTVGTQMVLKR